MIPREPNSPPWWYVPLVAALVLLAFAIVGSMDYADAVREHAHYCAMVEAGHWPDYRGIYKDECE